VSWHGSQLTHYPQLDGQSVASILEDRDGTVWAGGVPRLGTGRLCAIRAGKGECFGQDGSLGRGVLCLYEDRKGDLWASAFSGLWLWKPGPPKRYPMPETISDLIESDEGELLMLMPGGVRRLEGGKARPYPMGGPSIPRTALRDRDGGLWIGTSGRGLLHVHHGRPDVFSRTDGLSADGVFRLFEDREGNVWVSTYGGLDRFRELAIISLSAKQGLSGDSVLSVLAAKDGSIWLSGRDGLDRWENGRVTTFRKRQGLPEDGWHSLFQDDSGRIWTFSPHGCAYFEDGRFVAARDVPGGYMPAIAGDADDLWVSADTGLLRLLDGRLVEQFPWPRLGGRGQAIALAADRGHGGLWLGFVGGGVAYFKDGQVRRSYTGADGLGEGYVTDLRLETDGKLWASTQNGLSVIKQEHITTLTSRNGLPCDQVHWSVEADDRSTWLYMACGLARIARADLDAWMAGATRKIPVTVLEGSDGVTAHASPGSMSPRVVKSSDGRIWFVSFDGISVVDPRHLPFNKLPPPVHIESIKADGKPLPLARGMRLPAKVRDVWIDYTALSLVAPEKVRFKYMLEGQDRNWKEVVNDREAQYSNLPPRQYRFRVIASNNSGVWNETGDTLEFSIDPAYYQTTWFYASCVVAGLAMLWGLYRLRLYQVRREFSAHLDGRVDERLRVSRELHDTLLQSFQASLIRMQAARNMFARRPEKAVESLDAAITMVAGAVAEGRSAIQDLRVHPAGADDLAQLVTAAGQEMAHSEEAPENPPVFRVTVEGERRDLEPLLQDEVYRIARELLRNAFRHAQAGRIEAEIRYESRQLRVHVRDDGKGIDPEVLKAGGRAGHYGLPGMRERAGRFGGKLEFWSEAGAGTEAVLTVPAAAAYGASNGGTFSFLRRKLWIHER